MAGCSQSNKGNANVPDTPPVEPKSFKCLTTPDVEGEKLTAEELSGIQKQLATGIEGWVHGAVLDQQMFVFTWRSADNFFLHAEFPVTTKDPAIRQKLQTIKRHDRIQLTGEFIQNHAPISHINVTDLQVLKAFEGHDEITQYDPSIWPGLLGKKSTMALVHAVVNDGSVMVVEVEDRVIPVFNRKPELAKNLFRNDKIFLQYNVRSSPNRPSHLEVDLGAKDPVCVIERIQEGDQQPIELTGDLVMFPQSPQIIFNVFAIATDDGDGVRRQFTLLADTEVFLALRTKLQAVWDEQIQFAEYDRNKYINHRISITAKGIKNVKVPNQANPQILLESADDVIIDVL